MPGPRPIHAFVLLVVRWTLLVVRWMLLISAVALLLGATGAGFLRCLQATTDFFQAHDWLVWLLPLFGALTVWAYSLLDPRSAGGVRTLIREIKEPTEPLPPTQGPAIFATTLLAHLGGASVGREGTALQLGGALADQFSRVIALGLRERQTLLLCGVSAGFAAVFGTPFAAAVFALEFVRLRSWQIIPCLLTAVLADLAGRRLFGATHADYSVHFPLSVEISANGFLWAGVIGIACGLVARAYLWSQQHQVRIFSQVRNPYLRVGIGGLFFAVLISQTGGLDLTGLGLPVINAAFEQPLPGGLWLAKAILTLLCVCTGFRGGEVTPLFFIGATLGSALSVWAGLPLVACAGLGFVGVFAGAGAVPLACTMMACELFSPTLGAYALLCCGLSWLVAGRRGLYATEE